MYTSNRPQYVQLICAGWSFFRHNLTEEQVEDLPPGKGAAAAMLLTANASRAANATWTQRVRTVRLNCCTLLTSAQIPRYWRALLAHAEVLQRQSYQGSQVA